MNHDDGYISRREILGRWGMGMGAVGLAGLLCRRDRFSN